MRFPILAMTAIAAVVPTAVAGGSVGTGLSLTVPTICRIAPISGVELDANVLRIPQVREFCNRAGYEIYLRYDPTELSGTQVSFAGSTISLDDSGYARLLRANYAVSRISELRLELPDEPENAISLSLQMHPL